MLELGLLWILVHIGYFISGCLEESCFECMDSMSFTYTLFLLLTKKREKKRNVEKREKSKKKREIVNKVFDMGV